LRADKPGVTRWVRRMVFIVAALCTALPAGAAASASAGGATVVPTDSGRLRGDRVGGVTRFLGVPYAAPPVGELRWRPPQPAARWNGVRPATQFAPHCAQGASPFGQASASEDCLYLNVFTPQRTDRGLPHLAPVMVWIHGGALVVGESDDYDPARLVAQGVVVVTINYRLGALGFLAHPALSAESTNGASGNFGLLDQQAALRWVQRNVRQFGGDPGNVTIFGESAGGLSVHSQLVSPLAAGLFHRAIVQSGSYQLTQQTLSTAQAGGSAFATQAGCADQSLACLRGLPVATVLANQGGATTSPTVDGFVLTRSVGEAIRTGNFNHVPVVEGTTRDEWRLFVAQTEVATHTPLTAAGYIPAIAATLRVSIPVATALAAAYPLNSFSSPSVALGAIGTDAIFACNTRTVAGLLAPQVPTFQYEFNDPDAPMLFLPPVSFPTGAYHASEIQYVFNLTTPFPPPAPSAGQVRLAQTMVSYWTRFARAGDPNSAEAPSWPRYDADQRFQSLVPGTSQPAAGFGTEHRCSLFGG
jgi:para-nitrobenzyl esterase